MIETILNQINSNLERIAKALETQNINEVAGMVHETAKQFRQTESVTQQPTATVIPQAPTPVAQPVQQTVETQPMPVQPSSIPTTQVQNSFTQEQLAVAMSNAVSAGKMDIIQNILQRFNVQALTQINPADYNNVATMLKEAGVNV